MWEELWDLPDNGALSACLLLLITAGAVVGSVIYEKRFWCRFLCPIGAMNKMFATLSMTEIRTWKANCEGCTNPTCKVGGSPTLDPSDAFAIKGCTMDLKNNQLRLVAFVNIVH
jgi:polyferredoxin